jgi:hypothetical protein
MVYPGDTVTYEPNKSILEKKFQRVVIVVELFWINLLKPSGNYVYHLL